VLTAPEPFPVKDEKDLLKKLTPKKHGLIIQKGFARATFLPVVWEQLPTKEEFLNHLCMKAGLEAEAWKDTGKMKFFVYEAEEFEESD
jgi:AMMECR1 domain-containing protein